MDINVKTFDCGTQVGVSIDGKAFRFDVPKALLSGSVSRSGVTDLVALIEHALQKLAKDE